MVKPVLLIRGDNNESDEAALSELGILSVIDPYIDIKVAPTHEDGLRLLASLEDSPDPTWLLATSVNAVKFWQVLLGEERLRTAITDSKNLRFAAVGETTANALRQLGAQEVFTPQEATGQSLADELVGTFAIGHAVIPGGNLAMRSLPATLVAAGWKVSTGVVYETSPVEKEPRSAQLVRDKEVSAILFRSPSAVRALTHFLPTPDVPLICAGGTTAQALRELGLTVSAISPKPSAEVVASTIYSLLS